MAQYSCRLYINTGFNSINVPDTPALLEQMSFVDVPVLDINQERFLPFVNVRASWDTVKNCDYCKVGTFYYYVPSIHQSSGDVAVLTLIPDYALSAGGFAALEILDGLTDRVHVTDDTYGIYGGDDPYMNPAREMVVMSDTESGDFSGQTYTTFVETTLDLHAMGNQKAQNTQPAITAVDPNNEEYVITYPVVISQGGQTNYSTNIGNLNKGLTSVKGQGLYAIGGSSGSSDPEGLVALLRDGIDMARSLGVEQSISGQFSIPNLFVDGPQMFDPGQFQSGLSGLSGVRHLTGVPFVYGTANNKRIFYGSQTPYVLCSAAGNTVSCRAEEIYAGNANPSVVWVADPRRMGKPYYRFDPLNGVSCLSPSENGMDFFRNSVAGREWLSTPMVLAEKSGGLIDQINFNSSRQMKDLLLAQAAENKSMADLWRGAHVIGEDLSISGFAGGFNTVVSQAERQDVADRTYAQQVQQAALERAIEMQQFQISQNVTMPDVRFGGDPDLFAEASGNGFLVYRVGYAQADITRIDKILTAYGYKYTKILENTDFNNRTYFNYVSGSISVGNLPRWWADGIAAQLSGGVRVWHVRPNHAFYNNNPVVTPATPVTPVVGG